MTAAREERLALLAERARAWLGRIEVAWTGDHDTHGVLMVGALGQQGGGMPIARTSVISEAERLAELINVVCAFVDEMGPRTSHE